ncbi:MFS transporter [Cordyceps militaris]|uniref:MFS transporter n=1 Tax=Cordyceps militaris TaxID=73501 RepID=A0A2H4SDP3_CORMI|nr:MFS transporter [Cordyceps militaris]
MDGEPTEESRLLPRHRHQAPSDLPGNPDHTTPWRLYAAARCVAVLSLVQFATVISATPTFEIMEGIICHSMHPDIVDPRNDAACKDTDVQSKLSLLQGWIMPFALIPGLVTAVPYGAMADKYGRRLAIEMSIFWFSDVIPLDLICLAGLATLIGGGPMVISAMIFAMIGDICTPEQRTVAFFYLGSSVTVVELISGPLTYLLMNRGAWFCLFIGFAGLCLSLASSLLLPESRGANTGASYRPLNDEPDSGQQAGNGPWNYLANLPKVISNLPKVIASYTIAARNLVSRNTYSVLLLMGIVFSTLGQDVLILLLQYMTKRFSMSWADAALLLTMKSAVALGMTTIVLPLTSQLLLTKLSLSYTRKDLWMARVSASLLVLGALCLALAFTIRTFMLSLIIFTLGAGCNLVLRSLITSYAAEDRAGLIYTAISVSEGLGALVAGPVMASLFRLGLSWGGTWLGLPFLFAALLSSITSLILFLIPAKADES